MEIQKEEALLKGAKSMLLITKGPQKESARAESEACERRVLFIFIFFFFFQFLLRFIISRN